jgi:signal transduction histidine kinase
MARVFDSTAHPGFVGTLSAGVFLACLAVAAVDSESADWDPASVVIWLAAIAVVGSFFSVATDYVALTSGETFAIVLAAVLLGPAPAVAIATAATLVDSIRVRIETWKVIHNFAMFALMALLGALFFRAADEAFALEPASAAFVLGVVLTYLVVDAVNLLSYAAGHRLGAGVRPRDFAVAVMPMLPFELVAALMSGGIAAVYVDNRVAALATISLMLALGHYVVRELIASRSLRTELEALAARRRQLVSDVMDAEDHARQEVAQALHDETIQNLIAARYELEAAQEGDVAALRRADAVVQAAVEQLRETAFELHPATLRYLGLGSTLETLTTRLADSAGFRPAVHVARDVEGRRDDLLLSLLRGLIANAARHAHAENVSVRIWRDGETLAAEIRDDGVGFEWNGPAETVRQGHLGLAAVSERVAALGGGLWIDTSPGAGTRVRLELPVG